MRFYSLTHPKNYKVLSVNKDRVKILVETMNFKGEKIKILYTIEKDPILGVRTFSREINGKAYGSETVESSILAERVAMQEWRKLEGGEGAGGDQGDLEA